MLSTVSEFCFMTLVTKWSKVRLRNAMLQLALYYEWHKCMADSSVSKWAGPFVLTKPRGFYLWLLSGKISSTLVSPTDNYFFCRSRAILIKIRASLSFTKLPMKIVVPNGTEDDDDDDDNDGDHPFCLSRRCICRDTHISRLHCIAKRFVMMVVGQWCEVLSPMKPGSWQRGRMAEWTLDVIGRRRVWRSGFGTVPRMEVPQVLGQQEQVV